MVQYKSKNDTPLVFHNFFRFIFLPVNTFVLLTLMVNERIGATYFTAYRPIALIFTSVCITLNIIVFIGFFKWKPYVWYFVIARLAAGIAGSLMVIILRSHYYDTESISIIIERVGSLIMFCYIIYYYLKRKPLFFKTTKKPEASPSDEN